MSFNITEMISSITTDGVQSPNKFDVSFTSPKVMQNSNITFLSGDQGKIDISSTQTLLSFRASNARLPGLALITSDTNRYGLGLYQKMPYNVSFTDTIIEFICDKNSVIYNYFYVWFNSIVDFSGASSNSLSNQPSYEVEYKDNYVIDIAISIYDNYGNQSQTIILKNAFPVSINDIPLAWEQQNSIVKIIVGFSFEDWFVAGLNYNNQFTNQAILTTYQPNLTVSSLGGNFTSTSSSTSSSIIDNFPVYSPILP